MDEKFRWTIPNILSVYRLCISPLILAFIIIGRSIPFTVLLIISLVTDILDGFIARQFSLQTKIGAKLDSIADSITVLLAIYGMFRFKFDDIHPFLIQFYVLLGFYSSVYVVSAIKFRKFSSMHLYSAKITGYVQGIFFFILFAFDFMNGYSG
jgi:cardiolipin synthase (CMP-forming)